MTVPQRKSDAAGRRHRRAPARRHHGGVAGEAPRPIRCKIDPDSTVTAGNASGQNDGAAVVHRDHRREGEGTRAAPARPPGVLGRGRRAAAHHGHRPGARHGEGPRPPRTVAVRHGRHRTERGLRRTGPRRPAQLGPRRRPTSASTPTAPASPSDTPSAPPAAASSPPCCARWTVAKPATASRPCASAAARDWRRCSSGSDPETRV